MAECKKFVAARRLHRRPRPGLRGHPPALITGRIAPGKGCPCAAWPPSWASVADAGARRGPAAGGRAGPGDQSGQQAPVRAVLTADRLEQLSLARLWVEPELAARAAPNADASLIRQLQAIDARLDAALRLGDVDRYMTANHAFHFALYERAGADVLLSMAGGLWLQIGPFMRVVFGRVGAEPGRPTATPRRSPR
jgi:hypothetical protein